MIKNLFAGTAPPYSSRYTLVIKRIKITVGINLYKAFQNKLQHFVKIVQYQCNFVHNKKIHIKCCSVGNGLWPVPQRFV